jgi:hypothetical protein
VSNKLVEFPYIHLQIDLRCESSGRMPKHKTSMIRGIVGRILKKHVCHDFKLACRECERNNACVYSALFESPEHLVKKLNIGGTVPHPYILRCHDTKTFFSVGNILTFEIIILGQSADTLAAYLLHVIEELDRYSFGKDRLIFRVNSVYQLMNEDKKVIFDQKQMVKLEISYFQMEMKKYDKVMIKLLTPCRIIRKGKTIRQFSIEEFLWQVHHRAWQLYILNNLWTSDFRPYEFLPLLDEKSITVIDEEWGEIPRYSTRQKQTILLGGFKATVELQRTEELDQWLPLLLFGEKFHVGKATTFGLGQYELWFR